VAVAVRRQPIAIAAAAALVAWVLMGPLASVRAPIIALCLIGCGLAAATYLAWHTHPAYTFSGAIALSAFASNWGYMGLPGFLAPDRLLLVAGIAAVVLRAPPIRDREVLRFRATHWVMVVLLMWAVGSAVAAGTLTDKGESFKLIEDMGILPFLLFLMAPVAFTTEKHRKVLLGALVALGAYLGLTALFETIPIHGLVFPRYINDPNAGIHWGRARGPFLEAVTNGAALYACGVASVIAMTVWRKRGPRIGLGMVAVLCGAGLIFTETRSVWVGGVAASIVMMLFVAELRRWLLPVMLVVATALALSFALIPGFEKSFNERKDQKETVYDRKNLARAAENMVEAHPLVGIGWGRFTSESGDYFEQSRDYPLTATHDVGIHSVFLTYAAEIGLVGIGLWVLAVLLGVGSALIARVPPEVIPWKIGLAAFAIFFLVTSNFVFAQVFQNNMLWLLAGLILGAARPVPHAAVA
jgi:putative inorganic carbon (HCO3(-)) transporter